MYENKILHFFMYNTENSKNTFVFSHILFISKQTILYYMVYYEKSQKKKFLFQTNCPDLFIT